MMDGENGRSGSCGENAQGIATDGDVTRQKNMGSHDGAAPRVGMAVYGDITFDSRVRREAATLAQEGYDVTLVCLGGSSQAQDLARVRVIEYRPTANRTLPGPTVRRTGRGQSAAGSRRRYSWLCDYVVNLRAWGQAVPSICGQVDVWHLHNLTALAGIASATRGTVPVVYDTHELFLESGTAASLPPIIRRLLRGYEHRLVDRVAAVITVNDDLAAEFQRRYRPRRIEVVHNCPAPRAAASVRPALIQEAAGIPVGSPVVLYHGSLGPHRGIEGLMDALLVPGLERVHLVLLGPGANRAAYAEMARRPQWDGRVHILDPVPPDELLFWVASADVGAMPIEPSTVNHRLSTPNKLFECLAAGVPVLVSDFPAMRRIVTEGPGAPLGALCDPDSVDSIARALVSLLEISGTDMGLMRERCLSAARERWNWEVESEALLSLYRDLLPERPRRREHSGSWAATSSPVGNGSLQR